MNDIESLKAWVTLVGSIIAAVASSIGLYWKYSEKHDKIKIGYGALQPQISPGEWLHVVNVSDHRVELFDYGFIDNKGRFLSVPDLVANEFDDTGSVRYFGSLEKRNDSFQVEITLRDEQVGVYARTTTQLYRRISFDRVSIFKSIFLRAKIASGTRWQ